MVEGVIRNVRSAAGEALPAGQALHVWEVNSLRKVFPDTPPQVLARRVAVELARNEYEPFQLALRGAPLHLVGTRSTASLTSGKYRDEVERTGVQLTRRLE